MATRHHAREAVVQLLFSYDLGNTEVVKHIDQVLEEKKIRNKQHEFAIELFNGVMANIDHIDAVLSGHLEAWGLDRLGSVEKAILRLGTYEILSTDLDRAVIINEAIEIAKKLAAENSPKFINGVLDAVKKGE